MKVQVLLSSFNGEKYLPEQIESILRQEDVEVSLLIRDDGSSDNTVKIINYYKKKYDNIKLVSGNNVGWRESFLELIARSGESDYYAFSDQDDIWLSNKLARAVQQIERLKTEGKKTSRPILYQSISKYVDEDLNVIPIHIVYEEPKCMNDALLNSWAQGCNMVFNRELRDLLLMHKPSSKCAHDMWVYLVAYFFGTIIFDKHPFILYRQHKDNITGGGAIKRNYMVSVKSLLEGKLYVNYGEELYKGYRNLMNPAQLSLTEKWALYRKSMKYKRELLKDKTVRRQSILGTAGLKTMILLSRM